jgi:PST family polysaccharide transporter
MVARGEPAKLVRWRVISVPIVLTALVGGVHWGPVGVAVALAGSGLLVRAPLFFWFAGDALDIPPRRLFLAVAPHILSGLLVAAALFGLRRLWPPDSALAGVLIYAGLGTALYAVLVLLRPEGRAMAVDVRALFDFLRAERSPSGPAPVPTDDND